MGILGAEFGAAELRFYRQLELCPFFTCLINADGRMSSAAQLSKMERRDGLVFARSMRLIKVRSLSPLALFPQ
jgi:hypothetical protein